MKDNMTNYQYKKMIEMIIKIVKNCKTVDEAIKELEQLKK